MGERVPIFPKNESYQYPANLQKCQIYGGIPKGLSPFGGVRGKAPVESSAKPRWGKKLFNPDRAWSGTG